MLVTLFDTRSRRRAKEMQEHGSQSLEGLSVRLFLKKSDAVLKYWHVNRDSVS